MLDALQAEGIGEVCFVCGFLQQQLKDFVAREFPSLQSTWIENPEFATTNTAYSVFLTRDALLATGDSVLLINGDVVLDRRAIAATLAAEGESVLAVHFGAVAEEEVKLRLDGSGRVTEIGKHIPPDRAAGESVGINRLARELLPDLYRVLQERIETAGGAKEFYEAAFNQLVEEGAPFRTADVSGLPVMEVDTPEDYREVLSTISPLLLR